MSGALIATAATAAIPLIQRQIIDNVIVTRRESIWALAGLLLAAAVVNYAGIYLRRYRGGRLALDVQHDLRTELFDSLSRLDGARQDEIHTGQLVGRSISDLNMVQSILSMVPITLGSLMLFVLSICIMVALSPLLTIVTVAVAPALWLIALGSRRKLFPASWHAQQQSGDVAGVVDEAIGGVRVVKGFGQEEQEQERLEEASENLFASRLRMIRLTARYNPALTAVPSLGMVGVLALGGWLAIAGLDHAGHLPRVLGLPGSDERPGAHAHDDGYHRAGGAGQRHPGVRHHRLPARHQRQARRDRAPAGRGRPELRRRPVRLRAVRAGAARPFAPRRAGRDRRRGRRVRLGQVHPDAAAAPLLRPAGGVGPHRRVRRGRRDPRLAARRDRPGHGGQLPVLRHDPGQPRLRPPGCHRRAGHRRGPGGAGARVHRPAAAGLRHGGRRAGPDPVRRAAAAGGAGPGPDHRSPAAAARRRDLGHRPAPGGRDPRRAARGDAGPDHADHRAPPVHAEPGRPDRGPGPGPGRRQRDPRGAERALPAVPAAHHRSRR